MKYLKSILTSLSIFLILNLIITILSYFDIFNSSAINIMKIIITIITFLLLGITTGKQYKKKGLINGVIVSFIYILIFTIINLIVPGLDFSIKTFFYYLIIILITSVGSIIGTNIKKATK